MTPFHLKRYIHHWNRSYNKKKVVFLKTKRKATLAVLVSLQIVLTRLASLRISLGGIEGIRFGFGAFPAIFAGIAYGPLAGGLVGALGDVIGYFINPMGAYMPHFTLTAALTGAIPGLIVKALGGPHKIGLPHLLVAVAFGQLISSVLLVPLFLRQLFGLPLAATLPAKLVGEAVNVPLYAFLFQALQRRLVGLEVADSR